MSDDGPRIQIDDDWKAQAQAEKEKLASQANASTPASASPSPAGAAGGSTGPTGAPRELPPASFDTLMQTLASQALLYMGAMPDAQGRAYVSLEMARHQIDLLGVLEEKCKGNLSDDETKQLASTLYELRSAYVSVSQMVRDQALGKTDPAGAV